MFRGLRKILGICTLKDYLSKDENGITYLESLLKDGKSLDVFQEEKISNSIEAGYIYTKYNKRLYSFEYTEEQLFTVINGEYFIEYLLSKDNCTTDMIMKIENHIEIVELLIKYGKYNLLWLNKEIVNKLLVKDKNNNNYLIEKYINDDSIMDLLIRDCHNERVLLEICEKYNKYELLKCCNEEVLMTKTNNNETVLEILLAKQVIPNKLKNISDNKDYINFLLDKELYEYFSECGEETLLTFLYKDKTLLEVLLEKKVLDKLNFCITSPKTIKLLYKLNKLDLIDKVSVNLLKEKANKIIGKRKKETLLEYLLNNGYRPRFDTSYCKNKKDKKIILSTLYKRKEFELILKSMDKDSLFLKLDNGELLIDILLEKDINIFQIKDINFEKLFNTYKDNKTYLDLILEKIKAKKIKYNLNNISFTLRDVEIIAKFYITLAKHDMVNYVKDLSVDDLLKEYNDKMLLEELLDIDIYLTVNKILNKKTKSNIKIVSILKKRGIKLYDVDIPLINKELTYNYLNENLMKQGIGPLLEEGEYLLNELANLFLNDGKSDKELINALISGYRQALITNYNVFINEIKMLINLKKNNPRFKLLKIEDGAYFRRITGAVYCNCPSVDAMLHETGHACYYYQTKSIYPKNFKEILNRTRSNKNIIKKVASFSNEYLKIRDEIEKRVELKYNELYSNYYTKEKIKEIEIFLEKEKLIIKEELEELNIDSDIINNVLEDYYTKENYISNEKEKFIRQHINAILDEEYGSITSISDILDGIFEGELFNEKLYDENNKIIKGTPGHGISYYSCDVDLIFSEMIAQFSVISKSNDSYKMLKLLKDIIGEDLFNLLEDFYYNNIIDIDNNKIYKRISK